jgi:hypothetical protein
MAKAPPDDPWAIATGSGVDAVRAAAEAAQLRGMRPWLVDGFAEALAPLIGVRQFGTAIAIFHERYMTRAHSVGGLRPFEFPSSLAMLGKVMGSAELGDASKRLRVWPNKKFDHATSESVVAACRPAP